MSSSSTSVSSRCSQSSSLTAAKALAQTISHLEEAEAFKMCRIIFAADIFQHGFWLLHLLLPVLLPASFSLSDSGSLDAAGGHFLPQRRRTTFPLNEENHRSFILKLQHAFNMASPLLIWTSCPPPPHPPRPNVYTLGQFRLFMEFFVLWM